MRLRISIIVRLANESLHEWRCADKIVNMAVQTTASNTGHPTAACVAIQRSLGRSLLWSACRYHTGEVLLTHIFAGLKVETPRSPEACLFARLGNKRSLLLVDENIPQSQHPPDEAELASF